MTNTSDIENLVKGDFIYWNLHPDFKKEIITRYKAAVANGKEYSLDKAEAEDLLKTLGKKPVSAQMKEEAALIKDKPMYFLISDGA